MLDGLKIATKQELPDDPQVLQNYIQDTKHT